MTTPAAVAESTYNSYREWTLARSTKPTHLPNWDQLPVDVRNSWLAQTLGSCRISDPVPQEPPDGARPRLQAPDFGQREYLYFIRAETGQIKIGISGIPAERLKALQTASPVALELIGMIHSRNARCDESALHRRFAGLRCRGEWFLPGGDLLAYIASLDLHH